ncbi:hypothetical protein J7E35_22970 [Bacillus sp. ISL-45]|nr:hypothetical protein [Bacillus sp. ISL-45]
MFLNGPTILVDENNNIKEIIYSRIADEEAFIITQKLILGLDPTISIDYVNDKILFSGKEDTTHSVGEFEIGIQFDERGFNLFAVVK